MDEKKVFETKVIVRSYECDSYSHVNNAVYLNYFEVARMEILKEKRITLQKLKENGFMIVVGKAEITYKFPAREGDELIIKTFLKSSRSKSGIFNQTIIRNSDNKLIAEADILWVTIDLNGNPIEIPALLIAAFGI